MTKYEKVRTVAESVLQHDEALKYYTYGVAPQGCLFFLVFLAWIFGSAFVASAVTLLLFGPIWIVGFLLWIVVLMFAGHLLAPLNKPTVFVLTNQRLILVNTKASFFKFAPETTGIEKEYPLDALPNIKLKQFVRKFTLILESAGSTRKIQVVPWAENIDAARDIVGEIEGNTVKDNKLSILS
jgi:hypothetical protein